MGLGFYNIGRDLLRIGLIRNVTVLFELEGEEELGTY